MSMNIKKACIYTLGCKVNSFESEGIESILKLNGYEIVNTKCVADLYVINTCSVTNQADVKSRKVIHQCHKLNDKAIIVVMGCYSQAKAEEVANIEGVSIVLGTINKEYNAFNKHKDSTVINDLSAQFSLSKTEKNVVVFMLDRAKSNYLM